MRLLIPAVIFPEGEEMLEGKIRLKSQEVAYSTPDEDFLDEEMVLRVISKSLLEEPFLKNCSIHVLTDGKIKTVRESLYKIQGRIFVSVIEDEIILEGDVINLNQKRLAEIYAWRTPSIRNIHSKLSVSLQDSKEENDNEISDAVRMILERNPFLHSDRIGIKALNREVTLEGMVQTEIQRGLAESDVWHTIGVEKVINRLTVQN